MNLRTTTTRRFINLLFLLPVVAQGQAFSYRDPAVRARPVASLTAPTFVRAGTNTSTAVNNLTISSFNCSGGNYLLAVECDKAVTSRTVSSFTCNGVALSLIYDTNAVAVSGHLRMYGLANPATGDVTVTLNSSANTGISLVALLFNNVGSVGASSADYSTSLRTSTSDNLSTVATDLVVDALSDNAALALTYTPGTQTVRAIASATTTGSSREATVAGSAGTTTLAWTVSSTGDVVTWMGVVLNGQ